MRIYGILIGETSFGYRGFLYPDAELAPRQVVPEKGGFSNLMEAGRPLEQR